MVANEMTYILVLAFIILTTPFMPSRLLMLLDNIILRVLAILVLLYAISLSPIVGLLTLVAIGSLYLERNRRKVSVAASKLDKMDSSGDSKPATVQELATPQKTVPVRRFDDAEDISLHFLPGDHMGSDEFHPIGESINDKMALPSAPNGEHAASIFEDAGVAPSL
jgi:hypothetical protein